MKLFKGIYLLLLFLIVLTSFYYYAAFNDMGFNSDHAVHALMAKHFDWQNGTYYWGQNRLGSLLPWISSFPVKWFNWHPLYVVSVIHYIFLIFGYLLLARYLKFWYQKLIFALFIFWPLYAFHVLILIGHPYSSQLLLLALCTWALEKTRIAFLMPNRISTAIYLSVFFIFFCTAVWVSELSALFAILFLLIALFDKAVLTKIKFNWSNNKTQLFALIFIIGVFSIGGLKFFSWTKSKAAAHEIYDKMFITSYEDIAQQWQYLKDDVGFRLLHIDKDWSWTIFYYALLCVSLSLFVIFIYKLSKKVKINLNLIAFSFTLIVGCVLLFFSIWNYINAFDTRYFTPIYVLFVFYLLYAVQFLNYRLFSILTAFCAISALCGVLDNKRVIGLTNYNVREELTPFSKLPEGGLIGGYWLTYRVNAFAPNNLLAIPIDQDAVRNAHMVNEVMSKKRIYVIKNGFLPDSLPMPDTLLQHHKTLIKLSNDTVISGITFAPYKVAR